MTALSQLKAWNACPDGYAFCESKNVQTMEDVWQCLERVDWMLWVADKTGVTLDESKLRLFACDCAEDVLPNFESAFPDDKRPRNAIEVARRFARGEATREELESVGSAEWYAARFAGSAAMSAARSAARSAAGSAGSAAMSAARSAEWSAAVDAAWSARSAAGSAGSAEWSAAVDAAGSAAMSAAQKKYADLFRTYFPTLPTGGTE